MQTILLMMMTAGATSSGERVIDVGGMIDATINGIATPMRVDPAAPGMPLIDRTVVERVKLDPDAHWGFGIGYLVGGTSVTTRTRVVRFDSGGGGGKRRIGWAKLPFARGVEASVGPGGLDDPVVRLRLRAPRPGETTTTLRTADSGGMLGLFGHFSATFAEIDVGGEPMRVRFDPYHARSLATAGAAVRLARLYDGVVSGEPVPTEIFFGVERPVRTLTLRKAFAIGPLTMPTLGVRLGDVGSTASIAEAGAPPPVVDPDEVVVTAKGKKRDVRRDAVSLGADYLARCSSIVFDKPAKQIRLTCL